MKIILWKKKIFKPSSMAINIYPLIIIDIKNNRFYTIYNNKISNHLMLKNETNISINKIFNNHTVYKLDIDENIFKMLESNDPEIQKITFLSIINFRPKYQIYKDEFIKILNIKLKK